MMRRRDLLLWAGWLALLALAAFASRSYTPIDETRYLSVAWEMWQRGDFLVPFKNGEPYSHKPPLLFWLIHAGWWATGVNEWWPRLISPLFALICLVLSRRAAILLWPDRPQAARLVPWILLGSLLWSLYSQTIMFDLLMAFWVLLGILALVHASRHTPHACKLFALAIALGVLSKGPVILLHLLPPALLAPWWLSGNRVEWKRWYRRLALAVLGGALLALLWAVPAGYQGGEAYRNAIFWGQTANRMVESFAHQRPFWWYLPLLPALLYPWLLWPALWRHAGGLKRDMDSGLRLTLAWMLPALLAFSLVSGKQVHYLLPEFPAFALLAARLLAEDERRSRAWLPALVLVALGVVVLLLPVLHLSEGMKALARAPAWGGLGFFAVAGWLLLKKDSPANLVARLAAASMTATLLINLALFRLVAPAYDVHPMSREIALFQAQGRPVAQLGEYHAQYQFAGRLLRPIGELRDGREASEWLKAHPQGLIVLYFSAKQDPRPFRPLFVQPYLGGQAALFDAGQASAYLDKRAAPG